MKPSEKGCINRHYVEQKRARLAYIAKDFRAKHEAEVVELEQQLAADMDVVARMRESGWKQGNHYPGVCIDTGETVEIGRGFYARDPIYDRDPSGWVVLSWPAAVKRYG